ncbi:MAG: stage III sporulation protein AA [Clostridium sp.]
MGIYDEIKKVLPSNMYNLIEEYLNTDDVQEIRIKVEKPIIVSSFSNERIIEYKPNKEELKSILVRISNFSLYAYEEEIKQGYITLKGGHRVGLAGECIMEKGEVKTIKNISSLNIRICREVKGCSRELLKYISKNNRVYNTLIVSPPKCGKTTILRDIARNISNGLYSVNLDGKKTAIIDERSELAACFNGVPQMDIGIRTDVLDACDKSQGMIMAIRSLSPEVLICDEIGSSEDVEALNMALSSGVNIVVTLHGYDLNDILNRNVFRRLVENNILEKIVILSNKKGVGTIEQIYDVTTKGDVVKCYVG